MPKTRKQLQSKLLQSKLLRSKRVLLGLVVIIAVSGVGLHFAGSGHAYSEVWNANLFSDGESYPTVTNNNGDGYLYNNTRPSGTTWDMIYIGTVCGHGCAWPFHDDYWDVDYNGYAAYVIYAHNTNDCWGLNYSNIQMTNYCTTSSALQHVNSVWVAGPTQQSGVFTLINVGMTNQKNYPWMADEPARNTYDIVYPAEGNYGSVEQNYYIGGHVTTP